MATFHFDRLTWGDVARVLDAISKNNAVVFLVVVDKCLDVSLDDLPISELPDLIQRFASELSAWMKDVAENNPSPADIEAMRLLSQVFGKDEQ